MRLTWTSIQQVFALDAAEHLDRAQSLGLNCPLDVFEQLFYDHHDDTDLAGILRFVDWGEVQWEGAELSGVALRHTAVPREYRHAVDEAREFTALEGFFDERLEVMQHWEEAHTWIRAPIVIAGEVLHSAMQYGLIVGFTRLGNLLGALDRQDVLEASRHRAWLGRLE